MTDMELDDLQALAQELSDNQWAYHAELLREAIANLHPMTAQTARQLNESAQRFGIGGSGRRP